MCSKEVRLGAKLEDQKQVNMKLMRSLGEKLKRYAGLKQQLAPDESMDHDEHVEMSKIDSHQSLLTIAVKKVSGKINQAPKSESMLKKGQYKNLYLSQKYQNLSSKFKTLNENLSSSKVDIEIRTNFRNKQKIRATSVKVKCSIEQLTHQLTAKESKLTYQLKQANELLELKEQQLDPISASVDQKELKIQMLTASNKALLNEVNEMKNIVAKKVVQISNLGKPLEPGQFHSQGPKDQKNSFDPKKGTSQ